MKRIGRALAVRVTHPRGVILAIMATAFFVGLALGKTFFAVH